LRHKKLKKAMQSEPIVNLEKLIERVVAKLEFQMYLTPEEIAKKMKVQPITIKRLCYPGSELRYTQLSSRLIRIKTRDWIKYCEKREIKGV
jgi:hypothetical protein